MSRWRLPISLIFIVALTGCTASNQRNGDDDSGIKVPSVRMALLKIPLNRSSDEDLLDPVERFTPEPVAVSYTPSW